MYLGYLRVRTNELNRVLYRKVHRKLHVSNLQGINVDFVKQLSDKRKAK